ncbi:FMN-binding glutamate synthase family protein [Alkalihalobacillus sp. AL-G]|uniref:FMN-binding glutamate synthase family protein n=1 Tax=Alkalihalobacillus sp. AL-G TaxID=2926399 RepID=UPI00272A61D5|nr:FMN-binding glutamate synthase family protein [Alkalihalobacillus sp. AL-G]WLD95487.1 FMN-binding glutamate synthase family protein [Alkalihalobacillus sp. AL-G]
MGLAFLVPMVLFIWLYLEDARQDEHSVLRNYPVLGKARYIMEKMGPELRQYLFSNNSEGKPFSRNDYVNVVKAGKYVTRMIGFGSERDFSKPGYYIKNAFFPKQREEMRDVQEPKITTKVYHIDNDKLFNRKEHRETEERSPYLLHEEDAVVIGKNTSRMPFKVRGLVGQSAMSFGSLGDRSITALSTGLGLAGGTWMNTGEGGLSDHHLKGGVDIIMQIGPGLFGVRTKDGQFSWEEFKKKSEIEQVRAFELKLAQGAKTRGGHVDGSKINEEIARMRNVEPWKTVDSPNRFREFHDIPSMFEFMERLREISGKPIGMKIVVADLEKLEELAVHMQTSGKGPDFITVDGSEGGTGASYQELADSAGLPLLTALPLLDRILREYKVRDQVKIIAAGKLITPDKIAIALAMGADLVNIARGFMFSVGCIMAQVCHTNNCPVGVATTDPNLQKALSIEEKSYRVCNYVLSLREGLFYLAAAAGIESPTKFESKHITYRDEQGRLLNVDRILSEMVQL